MRGWRRRSSLPGCCRSRVRPPPRPDDPWPYVWPVIAPITDPFRAPMSPYGPGNRGIEFATIPGQTIVTAADGVVTFAGQVGGRLFVTVAHLDGVRTSYSYLVVMAVSRGESVRRGEPVGVAGSVFHVGARIGDAYIDPAVLFGGAPKNAHLVEIPGQLRVRSSRPPAGRSPSPLFSLGQRGSMALPRLGFEPLQSRSGTETGALNHIQSSTGTNPRS